MACSRQCLGSTEIETPEITHELTSADHVRDVQTRADVKHNGFEMFRGASPRQLAFIFHNTEGASERDRIG